MNKFNYNMFFGYDETYLVFNGRKYAPEEAYPIAVEELGTDALNMKQMYCYYGFGVDEDGDRRQAYWLTDERKKNSFPVLAYSIAN